MLIATFASAAPLTEQEARFRAAEWVRGPMFGSGAVRGPAADLPFLEVIHHTREVLLVVRGDTLYCGRIREPTWVVMWEQAAEWNGGYPIMIVARTGKVIDCR